MKKNFLWSMLAAVMVAMLSVSFASCSSDDDDNKGSENVAISAKNMVGTWGLVHSEGWEIWQGQKETFNDTYDPLNPKTDEDEKMEITNPSGNSLYFVTYEWDEIFKEWDSDTRFTLTLEGNNLTGGGMDLKVLSLTTDQMVLEMSSDSFYNKQTYKKLN